MPYTPGATLDGLQASLGDLTLGGVDSAGVAWYLQTLEGWDSPDLRSSYTDREGDHGSWASPAYLGARPLTLGGTIVAPSREDLDLAMDRLRAAASLTDTLLVVQETIPKQAVVRRSGKPLIQYVSANTATYSVMVTAADPRRYSITLQTGTTALPSTTGGLTLPAATPWTVSATTVTGAITATNPGTFATRPVFTVAGPVQSPKVVVDDGGGEPISLSYSQTLISGESLVIDCAARTVMLNGTASRRRYLTVTTWPEIPASGTVRIEFRAAIYNSSATLTAQWRPAWM
ncbi:phage distal tail protein [Streptomyces sp. SCL15-4]|uniref:phage distal tail protein n=1 Tax=Streptomyces sp. SCL15-4 TaxID=2967221 RepID=UPI002965E89D|nr:phage tail domain-containing protein [Streptomyces sp. SCL15-4]